jgi:hypothetical protein
MAQSSTDEQTIRLRSITSKRSEPDSQRASPEVAEVINRLGAPSRAVFKWLCLLLGLDPVEGDRATTAAQTTPTPPSESDTAPPSEGIADSARTAETQEEGFVQADAKETVDCLRAEAQPHSSPDPAPDLTETLTARRVWIRMSRVATCLLVLFLAALTVPYDTNLRMALMAEPTGFPADICGIAFSGHVPFLYVMDDASGELIEKLSFPVMYEQSGFHLITVSDRTELSPSKICARGIAMNGEISSICVTSRAAQCVYRALESIHTHILTRSDCLSTMRGCG